ncbi:MULTISPECIES: hypothetical protein [unclassified Microcoleus]|uniref:hypothetical protein n=1 Tax=unclassified Microcoleus TaxID=2642155 RepID=UPI002FCF7190
MECAIEHDVVVEKSSIGRQRKREKIEQQHDTDSTDTRMILQGRSIALNRKHQIAAAKAQSFDFRF